MQLAILADDFTGAGDAAAPFAAAGLRTLVVLSAVDAASIGQADAVDVLAVDLDLREAAHDQALQKTAGVARLLGSSSTPARVLLKIDSTLRGPIAGLLAGALEGSGRRLAVIAPAFPEQGRLLRDGSVLVDGQAGPSLTALLGSQGTALVAASQAGSATALERAVEQARARGAWHVVVDADTPACLRSVATAWRAHPDWLLVGSGGLTRQVAEQDAFGPAREVPAVGGPILVIAGSPTPVTRTQLEHLQPLAAVSTVAPYAPIPPVPVFPDDLLVLRTLPAAERDRGESAQAVADTVAEWSRDLRPGAVIMAGGATARAVCERLGAVGVRLLGELSPGIPVGHLIGGTWHDVLVVTKAGGFGTPTTLLDVVRALGVLSTLQP